MDRLSQEEIRLMLPGERRRTKSPVNRTEESVQTEHNTLVDVGSQTETVDTEDDVPLDGQRSFDYILVASIDDNVDIIYKREKFIHELRKKVKVKCFEHKKKLFFGLKVYKEMFEDYRYLLKVSDSCNWTGELTGASAQTTRIRLVHYILHQTYGDHTQKLLTLMDEGVFECMYCLHEPIDQQELANNYLSWMDVFTKKVEKKVNVWRNYFGEKVALYFLWFSWYNAMLAPAALLGSLAFLWGFSLFKISPLIVEVCESNITMCPRCENCKPWKLSDSCFYATVTHLFDNEGIVAFAMFMAIWATIFLQLWKRHRVRHVSHWNMYNWSEEEDELIMKLINNPRTEHEDFVYSLRNNVVVIVTMILMMLLIVIPTHAIVVFRAVITPLLSTIDWNLVVDNVNTVAVMMGAVLHYCTMQVMTLINTRVCVWLAKKENLSSHVERARSFTIKTFILQFLTLFSSLFYVAFILGRVNGYPGNYVLTFGYRREECHPSGCLTDLFLQMAIIMFLKQVFNNMVEYTTPLVKGCWSKYQMASKRCLCCPVHQEEEELEYRNVLRDYHLMEADSSSLFYEFLEMVMQFSFTTIFVAAFPLAPLFALFNNIIEIRMDSYKLAKLQKRLIPRKSNDIGAWTEILEAIGVLAVIANGFVIGVSSDFIPRFIYKHFYGPCATGNTKVNCMTGYINHTLTTAYMKADDTNVFITPTEKDKHQVIPCSFRDYRRDTDHSLTPEFWVVLAARFAFIIVFEHVLLLFKMIASYFFPESPHDTKNDTTREKLLRLQKELLDRRRARRFKV